MDISITSTSVLHTPKESQTSKQMHTQLITHNLKSVVGGEHSRRGRNPPNLIHAGLQVSRLFWDDIHRLCSGLLMVWSWILDKISGRLAKFCFHFLSIPWCIIMVLGGVLGWTSGILLLVLDSC